MSLLSPITDAILATVTGSIMPAVLAVMGAMLVLSITAWGLAHLYAYFTGGDASAVIYKIARAVGSEVYESDYRKYKSKSDARARNDGFRDRYVSENFNREYDRGRAKKGRDFS